MLMSDEFVYSNKVGGNNKQLIHLLDHKHISWMMDVRSTFSQLGSIVMDPLFDPFAISTICMTVPIHRRRITGDLDAGFIKHEMIQKLDFYALPVFNRSTKKPLQLSSKSI